jgi:ABC-type bacteriocin/lantibiotic exporter with double-glycine peptidase domain
MLKPHVCVRQNDITDCGAACLATVARTHGLRVSIAMIRQHAGTDTRGTSVLGLVEAAQQLGFEARGVRGSLEALGEVPLPCIAHVVQNGLLHYVTILKITIRSVVVADPARGIVRHSLNRFKAMWTGVLVLLVPSRSFRPGDQCLGRRRGLLLLLRQNRFLLFETLLATLFLTLLGLGTSLYLQVVVDRVLSRGDRLLFYWLSAGFMILVLVRASFGAIRGALSAYVSRAVDLSLMLDYYRQVASGEILSRLADAVKIRTMICNSALTLLVDTATMAAGFAVLFSFSGRLAFPVLAVVLCMIVVLYAVSRPLRRAQRSILECAAELQSRLVESLAGISTIKAFRAEESEGRKAETALVRLLRHSFRASLWGMASGTSAEVATSLAIVSLLWSAAWMVIAGQLTIGHLVACYSILLYMLQPVSRLAELNQQVQDAWIAAERLYDMLELPREREEDTGRSLSSSVLEGRIELRDVGFRYGAREPVLCGVTLSVEPCSLLAIVGESGSGKSTLARLLLRFHDPQAGQIKIDGHPLPELNLDSLRSKIGYVDQDAFFFSGTIEENLTLGDTRRSRDAVLTAIRAVGLEDFVLGLPRCLETPVGERGLTLSAGQRQRLALARVLVSDPPILILDEATSHLDLAAERKILELILHLKRCKTIVMIGHQPRLSRHADRIAVLGAGRILEQGTHEELVDARGPYRSLWESYSQGITAVAQPSWEAAVPAI